MRMMQRCTPLLAIVAMATGCLMSGPAHAAVNSDAPKTCAAPDAGYTVERSVRGPIGKPDTVDVCVDVLTPKNNPDGDRRMRFYTGGKLSLASNDITMCQECGGMIADPLVALEIKRGSLFVSNLGGSRERWGEDWVFTMRDGRWVVAGWTLHSRDTMTGLQERYSVNALTGEVRSDYVPPDRPEPDDTSSKRPSHLTCTLPNAWRTPATDQLAKIRTHGWDCAKLAKSK
ncbi:hypothetical protein [Ralstonia sp. ASV6]|uniref:hypothetical protein n=1 Tax=Ralstonia sp. ASV6 TaxID=2795124 RepID=UPI0018EBFB93|nr:hypothetical protein [Ralstonia sp. ASV6]